MGLDKFRGKKDKDSDYVNTSIVAHENMKVQGNKNKHIVGNYREQAEFADDLKGLARQCPKCKIIAHHGVKGRKPQDIICPNCDHEFTVQKYKRGERPKENV